MPSFYPRVPPGHMPLTPPEFVPSYESQGCAASMSFHQDPYVAQRPSDCSTDYSRAYAQAAPNANFRSNNYSATQTLPPISSYYDPQGVSALPSLRTQDRMSVEDDFRLRMEQDQRAQVAQQQAQQQQLAAKEDKATGGVSAKLDYDMERMTDFVAEAAQGIIQPPVPIQPSFRKWVLQVLSATRLPSTTILLSLHYLTVRLRDHPPRTSSSSENQIYRLLAVALILGSKFLDDNTFINRSWSDVSGIRVLELNELEMEWLSIINFKLHIDPNDANGFSTWQRAWKEYDSQAQRLRPGRLSPLNTNVQRQAAIRNSHSPYQQQFAKGYYADFTPQSSRSSSTYSGTPYLTADPWNRSEPSVSADAFYNARHRYPTYGELDHANTLASIEQIRRAAYGGCALPPPSASAFISPWNQSTWGAPHPHGCNCMACSRQYMSYMPTQGYPAQTVVG